MKKLSYFLPAVALLLSAGFVSCGSNDDGPDLPPVNEPQLITFSFQQADNADVISENYDGVISGDAVTVTMPEFADKSSLVATFTTAEGNLVTVDGVTQVSGASKNDFSVPVDYIVSSADGKQNKKYTVTVVKAANYVWSQAGTYSDYKAYNVKLALSPADGIPYLAYKINSGTSATNKLAVMKFNGTSFESLGAASGVSTGEVYGSTGIGLAVDKDGKVYAAYGNNAITDPMKGATTVQVWDGSSWSFVGPEGIIDTQSQYVNLGIVDGKLIVSQENNSTKSTFAKRSMPVSFFNGSTWESSVPAVLGTNAVAYCWAGFTSNAAYYITYNYTDAAGGSKSYSVIKYSNGQWEALRSNYIEPSASQVSLVAQGIAATEDGVVYIINGDDAGNDDYDMRVQKYDPETKAWTLVGGNTLGFGKLESHLAATIAVAPNGTPFVAWNDTANGGEGFLKVIHLDPETKQWTAPETLVASKVTDVNIQFASNGEAYIAYVDDATKAIGLLKYAPAK